MANPRWTYDRKEAKRSLGIVGVDEAGRGCLAGPVVAGAVVLPAEFFLKAANRKACAEMNDSKQFAEERREELYAVILSLAKGGELFWASGESSVDEIESGRKVIVITGPDEREGLDLLADRGFSVWRASPDEMHLERDPAPQTEAVGDQRAGALFGGFRRVCGPTS